MASHVAIATPQYLASLLDSATVGCFLLLEVIGALPSEKVKPDVDLPLLAFPAQSADSV